MANGLKKSKDEIISARDYTEDIVKSMTDTLIVVSPDATIRTVNQATLNLLGREEKELIGQPIGKIFEEEIPHVFKGSLLEDPARTGSIRDVETNLLTRTGERVVVLMSGAVLKNREGKSEGLVLVAKDLTERKRAEETLIEANRRLEEATARANDMAARAEAANIAKSQFLANMSHELRTPMNGVIGMASLLIDTELDEVQCKYAEIVLRSGDSMMTLINDVLDFAKIEAGKLDIETLDFDLSRLLDEFAAMLALQVYKKGLELLCAADPAVPTLLRGDPGRLRQILHNLAGNAVKFTHTGTVAIRVSLVKEEGSGSGVQGSGGRETVLLRFSVRDTGIGIPKDKIGLLFERFSQVDGSSTRKYGGTGLGLSIVKQLAGLMGGEVGVESEAGKGSEFWFTARLGTQARGAEPHARPIAPLHTAREKLNLFASCKARILLAEDNIQNQQTTMAILHHLGLRADAVANGVEVINAVKTIPYDLVLMDVQMPEMDGIEATRWIRDPKSAIPNHQIPIIAMTAYVMQNDLEHCLEAGMNDYIAKPVSLQALAGALDKWLLK